MAIELLTAAINTPRRGYDPVSGALRGLLIEESRTNLFLYSEQLDNAFWAPQGLTISADATTAPDGNATADKLVEDTTNAQHRLVPGPGTTAGTPGAASFFVKAAERTKCAIYMYAPDGSTSGFVNFDLSGGIIHLSAPGLRSGIEDVGGGWYWIWASQSPLAGFSSYARLGLCDDYYNATYAGDGASGLYAWGGQFEEGMFPTSYIPTTSASVTRAADSALLDASWMRSDRGCFVGEVMLPHAASADTNPRVFRLSFSTGSWDLTLGASSISTNLNDGTNNRNAVTAVVVGAFESHKVAATFGDGRIAICADGGSVASNLLAGSVGLPSAAATLRIGAYSGAGNCLNGWLKTLRYFPYSPSDADLQALTT